MKDKYVMKYNGNKWELAMKEDLINRIYDDTKYYIEQNLDKFTEDLLPSRKKTLARWLETDENDARIKKIKEDMKLLLYNLRHIPINTQNGNCIKANTVVSNIKVHVKVKLIVRERENAVIE